MKWLYRYCFNVHLDDDSLIDFYHFNNNKVNTIFAIIIFTTLLIFSIIGFVLKIPILSSTTTPYRYKIAIYIHMSILIVEVCLQAMNSVVFIYLRYGKLSEKQELRLHFWSYLIQDFNIIVTISTFAFMFILQVSFGSCPSNATDSIYCNDSYNCQQLPFQITTIMLLMPHAFPCLLTGIRFWAIVTAFLISFFAFIYGVVYMGIWKTAATRHFIVYFIICNIIMIYETERQKLQLFLSNRDLQIQMVENQRLEKETRTSEMRYMIYNLGSTIKDVSLCICSFTADCCL